MFNLISQDQNDDKLQKRITELTIEHEALNLKVAKIMEELELKPEQVTQYLANPENFSEKNWTQIQEIKNEQSQKLMNDLLILSKNPRKKKSLSKEPPKPHWVMMK